MKIYQFYVYMLTNVSNKVLYTGVTNELIRRIHEHKTGRYEGPTKKYRVNKLINFETFDFIDQAIAREKQIKGYSRSKKNQLIEGFNPAWEELNHNGIIKHKNL
jgi:putative endonuclease